MARDLTLGATHRRLHDLGYAATSATNPDRIVGRTAHSWQRDSFLLLREHPAAVMCYPTTGNGASEALDDLECRGVLSLIITAYVLADAKQWKPIAAVLGDYLCGPYRIDSFGNRLHPLRWNGKPIFDGDHGARLCFDDDDATVFFEHAIAPNRYVDRTDSYARVQRVAAEPIGSHVISLDGDWKSGSLLDTPRDKLPELLGAELQRLVSDIERARWDGRPAAAQKDAA